MITNNVTILPTSLAVRTTSMTPSSYRLFEKKDGTNILQGYFTWQEGFIKTSGDWKDIPTVKEE